MAEMSYRTWARKLAEAERLGRARGQAAGSWVIDGNTSAASALAILTGYEDGDPEIMDLQPDALSGEWADAPTPQSLAAELGLEDDIPEGIDDLSSSYEGGFSEGFWDEVVRSARAKVGRPMRRQRRA